MDTGLEASWNKLSLTENELYEVIIDKNWVDDNAHARRNCLIGKMVIKRAINLEAMKTMLQKVWKLSSGMVIKEVYDQVFVFQLEDC